MNINKNTEHLSALLNRYDTILFVDTETTGLSSKKDRVIELGVYAIKKIKGKMEVIVFNKLVNIPENIQIPEKITELTGITREMLRENGQTEVQVIRDFMRLVSDDTLLIGHNLHFDFLFIKEMIKRSATKKDLQKYNNCDLIDSCTILRDRISGSHRLADGINHYRLNESAVNSHRALDDALAVGYLIEAMAKEKNDIGTYINWFGYNPKYGAPEYPIHKVTYFAQV